MEEREGRQHDAASITSLGLALLIVVAVLRVGVHALRDRTVALMPDLWETVLGTQAAGAGRQLVGAWSRLGLYHPGPAWFWWAAPFLWLSDGHPSGLTLAAAALAATALALTFLAARSATDGVGALVVAATLALGVGQLSTQGLAIPWNPTIVILPITAGIVCVAVVATRGTTWPAVAAVLLGTLVAQAHLGTLMIGATIVIGALIAWQSGDRKTATSPPRWHSTVLVLAAVLPWVPVIIDQFDGVGNAATVVRYLAAGTVDARFPPEPIGPSSDLSPGDALRQVASITSLTQEDTADWAGANLTAGRHHDPSPTSTVVTAGLLGVALAASRPERWRRGSTDVLGSWICRFGLLGAGWQVAVTLTIRHEFRPYLVAGAAGVGLALWIGAGLVALHAVRSSSWVRSLAAPRRAVLRTTGTVVVALGTVLAVAGYAASLPGYQFERRGDAATLQRVETALEGDHAQIHLAGGRALQPALTLTAELQRVGTRLAVRGRYRARFSDLQRNEPAAPADHDLWVIPTGAARPKGCTDLGPYQGAEVCVVTRS